MLSCDKRLQPETWNPSGPQENVFCKPTFDARVSANTLPRDSSHDVNCCRSGSRADQHRETCGKRGWKKRKPGLWRKSRPTALNLTSSVAASSSDVNSPMASRSPGGTQRFKSTGWIIREACGGKRKSKFQLRRSVDFSRMAKRCSTVPQYRETCGNEHGSELSELAGRIPQHRETCGNDDEWTPRMFRKIWTSRRFRRFRTSKPTLATSFPYITWICASHGEGLLDRKKGLWSETDGQVENTAIWGVFMSVTLGAAVHLGRDYSMNLRSVKNQSSKYFFARWNGGSVLWSNAHS